MFHRRHRETEESTKVRCIHCFEAFGYGRYLLQGADCGPGEGGGRLPYETDRDARRLAKGYKF